MNTETKYSCNILNVTTTKMEPPPTNSQPDPLAIKIRIINQMNTSHQDSLTLFLRHYCHVPAASAKPSTTTLTGLNQDSLILSSSEEQGGRKRYYIPLTPPLPSLTSPSISAEIRQRLKDMHGACLAGLGLSPIKITRYIPPQSAMEMVTFVCVVLTMLSFSWRGNFQPGSPFYQTFGLGYVPAFAGFCRAIQPWLLASTLTIHGGEAVWMARTRLRRHQVEEWSWLWWRWVGTCFFEGFFSFRRFDGMVKEMEGREKR